MIVGVIIDLAVGLCCIILGLLIWKKQKISLLHDYHYQYVKREAIPAYTLMVGRGIVIVGAGIAAAGLFDLVMSPLWWVPMAAGFVLGLALVIFAQRKYNRPNSTED